VQNYLDIDPRFGTLEDLQELTAEAHLGLADVLRLSGRREEASSAATAALAIYEQRGMKASAEAVRGELAELQSTGSPSQ